MRTILIAVILIVIIGLIAAGVSYFQGSGVERDISPANQGDTEQTGT